MNVHSESVFNLRTRKLSFSVFKHHNTYYFNVFFNILSEFGLSVIFDVVCGLLWKVSIKYQPEYSMWLKRSKAHYQKIIYNNLITWKASFISFDYLSIENSSTRREQIFSVFNPLEINVFDQTLTKPNFSDFVVQIIWWELKWYMTDLNNVLYFARYSY